MVVKIRGFIAHVNQLQQTVPVHCIIAKLLLRERFQTRLWRLKIFLIKTIEFESVQCGW
jgi:hypothetical protein